MTAGSDPLLFLFPGTVDTILSDALGLMSGAHQAGSHQHHGWEQFTDAVIRALSDEREELVYILWGNYAQKKGAIINKQKNLVLESAHPSPLSAHNGFFGSRPFSKTNIYLMLHGQDPIEW